MGNWRIKQFKAVSLKNGVLIEGLPGIGNVGKVAVDFLIDELEAIKLYEISSFTFPHSVFINEDNLVELPKIEIFYKKAKGQDFLLLSGDVQPIDEVSSYEFSEKIIDICKKHGCRDIITLGGIGLSEIPKKPKVYCTGNTSDAVKKYKDPMINTKLYGVVGPIVGVSGLLLGLSEPRIRAVALLAETYGHPMYLGINGAKEILKYLGKRFGFAINTEKLDKEVKAMEKETMKRTEELSKISKKSAGKRLLGQDVNYIG
ncbi:PAC2 family protein [Candidatus Woesearchaeota archaeon]|nr:PAC2 family protein [Candidatus Woesearchaeota archaeon]